MGTRTDAGGKETRRTSSSLFALLRAFFLTRGAPLALPCTINPFLPLALLFMFEPTSSTKGPTEGPTRAKFAEALLPLSEMLRADVVAARTSR